MGQSKKKAIISPKDGQRLAPIQEVQKWLIENWDIRMNSVTNQLEGCRTDSEDEFKIINENSIYIELLEHRFTLPQSKLWALLYSGFIREYNPFQEYFKALPKPDGDHDSIIKEFAAHVKAIDQEEFNNHFVKMMVRTIACALEPNTFNKQCFTLVGKEQNTGKSTFLRYLAPPPLKGHYTEHFSNDKDGQIALVQNFIINLDELAALNKWELNQLKSTLSRTSVSVRHPFQKKNQSDPRRASFVGSTNEDSFLSDSTGSVRWLCFTITKIDWSYTDTPIDLIWAAAYALYKNGFKYQLTTKEIKDNEQRNEQFKIVTTEQEYIQRYFEPGIPDSSDSFLTSTEIMESINKYSNYQAGLKSTVNIGRALTRLGYEKGCMRPKGGGTPIYGYFVKDCSM